MNNTLISATFTFIDKKHGEIKVVFTLSDKRNITSRRDYYKIFILRNGEALHIGMKFISRSSQVNKTKALEYAKELLSAYPILFNQ